MILNARANRTLIIKLTAALVTYGFTILMARTMSAAEFGTVALFLNAAFFLSVVGARGQQISTLRFVPPLVQEEDRRSLQSFTTQAMRKAVFGALVLAGLTFIAALAIGPEQLSTVTLLLGLSLVPLVGWVDMQAHVARGHHLIALALVPREILWRCIGALAVLALFLANGRTPIPASPVLAALAATLALIAAVQAVALHRATGLWPLSRRAAAPMREWDKGAGSFWLTSVSNTFLAYADVLAVGLLAGPAAAGLYFAANRLAMLLAFFQTSYNTVLGPMLAEAWHGGNKATVATLLRSATIRVTLPTVLLGAALATLAPQVLHLFSPEFTAAATPLRLLVLAGILNAATGPADIALNMCGFQRPAMQASAVSLGLNTLFLVLGTLLSGATGAAFAVLLGTALRKGLFWRLARHHLGLRTDAFASRPPNAILAPVQ